jgi:hypothetical protein
MLRPRSITQKYCLVLVSVRIDSRPIVRQEGSDILKNFSDLIGTQTCDLPACSVSPYPTALRVDRSQMKLIQCEAVQIVGGYVTQRVPGVFPQTCS